MVLSGQHEFKPFVPLFPTMFDTCPMDVVFLPIFQQATRFTGGYVNIEYSKKKQEMRRDPLMEFLVVAKQFFIARSNTLIGFGVGAAIVIAALAAWNSIQKRQVRRAQEAFGNAMVLYAKNDDQKAFEEFAKVIQSDGGSPHAAYSAYLMGQILMKQGKYQDAIKWFEIARTKGSANFVGGSAIEGLAACYESLGQMDKAQNCFAEAMKNDQLKFRQNAIRWKLALINQEQKQFDKAMQFCGEIVADTSEKVLRDQAANLLEELKIQKAN
jgi:tetratricopeptide (TPR) repeat protein